MEKIAKELLLPPMFFHVCFNTLLNSYYDTIESDLLFLYYIEFLHNHLSESPFSCFRLEKYSEKSYVLYKKEKTCPPKYISYLLEDLKGIENKHLKKGAGFIFPNFRLPQLKSFLLQMPHKKSIVTISKQAEELESVPIRTHVESYLLDLRYHMNQPVQDCKKLVNKSIPIFYDCTFIFSDISNCVNVSQHIMNVAVHFLFKAGQQTIQVTTRTKHNYYTLVISLHNVKETKQYKQYSEQHNMNWMNSSLTVSKDNHIMYYSYTTFTGD